MLSFQIIFGLIYSIIACADCNFCVQKLYFPGIFMFGQHKLFHTDQSACGQQLSLIEAKQGSSSSLCNCGCGTGVTNLVKQSAKNAISEIHFLDRCCGNPLVSCLFCSVHVPRVHFSFHPSVEACQHSPRSSLSQQSTAHTPPDSSSPSSP